MGIHGTYYDFGNMESHNKSQPSVPPMTSPNVVDRTW